MREAGWTTFSIQQPPKKKRARVACIACHAKKVRCDLQVRWNTGYNNCSACAASKSDCQVRVSKHERQRQNQNNNANSRRDSNVYDFDGSQGFVMPNQSQPMESHAPQHIPQGPQSMSPASNQGRVLQVAQRGPQQLQRQHHPAQEDYRNRSMIQASPADSNAEQSSLSGYAGDTGFLNVYGPEHENDAHNQASVLDKFVDSSNLIQPDLLQSFAETYFEYCYPWCPVLDKHDLFINLNYSPLLTDALALVGSHVQPPIVSHLNPVQYYDRARKRFYDDEEPDTLMSLRAISLFYWWSHRAPTVVHRHSSWWWTSVIIRHAQQMGIHKEPPPGSITEEIRGIRRRLWWTVFARERLTAVCQGKPCMIDLDECDIKEVSLEDFPPDADRTKAEIFIHWVRLSKVIGKIAKYLSKSTSLPLVASSEHPSKELVAWVNSLPPNLQLPIDSGRTTDFNRDVHQLYLPYLAVIIVLHLKRSGTSLPTPTSTAILAATCIARIYRDILVRGGTRFLMAINCWYCATAFYALSQSPRRESLKPSIDDDLDVLYATIKQLQQMWGTANIFEQGFRRLRAGVPGNEAEATPVYHSTNNAQMANSEDDSIHWLDYFPFVTPETSPITKTILAEQEQSGIPYLFPDFSDDFSTSLHYLDLFESFDNMPGLMQV